jgi:hypothetical protein
MADQQLRLIATVIDRASGPLRSIAGRIRAIAATNHGQRIANSFRAATAAAAAFGGVLSGAVVGGLGLLGIGAISAGAALAGLLSLMSQSRDRLDALDEQAQQTGFSLQQLRELQFISTRGGIGWETMSAGLLQMSKRVGELKSGTGAFGKQLAKTYPALYKQLKASKSNTQAFSILHKAMSKIEDPAKRIAFAMKMFGKPGAEIAKMGMSTQDFLKQMQRARHFKGILPEDAGERMGAANDAIDDLKDAFEGLTDLISYETAPAFTDTVNAIAEFVAVNRQAIATGFKEFLIGVKDAVKNIDWSGIVEGFRSFGETVSTASGYLGGFKGVMIALTAIALAPYAVALLQLGAAITQLNWALAGGAVAGALNALRAALVGLGALAMANPVTALVVGVGVAAGLLITHSDAIGAALDAFGERWRAFWGPLAGWFKATFVDPVASALDWIAAKISGFTQSLPGIGAATSSAIDSAQRRAQEHGPVGVGRGMPGKSGHTPETLGKQSSLIERSTRSGAAANRLAMSGSADVNINVRSSDGLRVAGTETRSAGLINRVNLNRGPSMATG